MSRGKNGRVGIDFSNFNPSPENCYHNHGKPDQKRLTEIVVIMGNSSSDAATGHWRQQSQHQKTAAVISKLALTPQAAKRTRCCEV